jgi:hypothetical protein
MLGNTGNERGLRAGDVVEVRSAAEILATLDQDSTLDSLPFMPEMLDFCGRRFNVFQPVTKICVEGGGIRAFARADVVLLQGVECNGSAHDGCEKACMIFWKEAWLKPSTQSAVSDADRKESAAVASHLRTTSGEGIYFCQSTELIRATARQSVVRRLRMCLDDLSKGTYKVGDLFAILLRSLSFKFRLTLSRARGALQPIGKTPTVSLGLKAGDLVEVKAKQDILKTLDRNWKNRGLLFSRYMPPFCEGRFRVKQGIQRMILEDSGKMRQLNNTVLLEKVTCDGRTCSGYCPRNLYHYWREVWLNKV